MRPMHGANHGVSHTWEPATFIMSSVGVGEQVRGKLAGSSAGMFCHDRPIVFLIVCGDDTLQPHPFSYSGLTGGSLCNNLSELIAKASLKVPAFGLITGIECGSLESQGECASQLPPCLMDSLDPIGQVS